MTASRDHDGKRSVAIAGAGLSGLCLAQSLLASGFDVHVYERDPSPEARRQGYRITAQEQGIAALQRCLPSRLFELVLATASPTKAVGYFRFTNRQLGEVFTLTFKGDPGGRDLRFPRQVDRHTLRSILLSGLQGRVHFGKAAARVETTSEGATLSFDDGSSTHAALVVGADGVHSALREQLLPDCRPVDTGYIGIYGRSPLFHDDHSLMPQPLENSGVLAMGAPGRAFFFTTMRFQEPPSVAFARLAPDIQPSTSEDYVMWALLFPQEELPPDVHMHSADALHHLALEAARDFHPVLRHFVERADVDYTTPVTLSAAKRPTTWPVSRATLMGDAVHVMPPFTGQGGNSALRDAALLGERIQHAARQGEPLDQAIRIYQEEMIAYAFPEVDASMKMMRRSTINNAVVRWAMLRAVPWLRSLTGRSTPPMTRVNGE
jgi:2-polyprenyl-6-methoxyphenol hydroxylase-like FAD-dependent oxidoreductase